MDGTKKQAIRKRFIGKKFPKLKCDVCSQAIDSFREMPIGAGNIIMQICNYCYYDEHYPFIKREKHD
jgi:hypothetical protein